jgi:CRISPR-associated protein Cst2
VPKLESISLCARVTLDLHNLNSEGSEGSYQQTRMVHIVDTDGNRQIVNAVSGDMFKHIYVEHLTRALEAAGQPLSSGAQTLNPDRVNVDENFRAEIKNLKEGSAILKAVIARCSVTDIVGTLITEGRVVARKSCVEFGWVVGLPEHTVTEQYFHAKYEPESRAKSTGSEEKGQGTLAGKQAIFHRPANSGVYALICQVELGRIGKNDITRKVTISEDDLSIRRRAAIEALIATLVKPSGAQRNTQNPHIVGCEGIIAASASHLPSPCFSPLTAQYREQIEALAGTLNKMQRGAIQTYRFQDLAGAAAELQKLAPEV